MTKLFGRDKSVISRHITNVFKDEELDRNSVVAKNATTVSDSNKRIVAFLILYFMERNGILFNNEGQKKNADYMLVALTLMIAISKHEEKNTMVKLIVNLIIQNN